MENKMKLLTRILTGLMILPMSMLAFAAGYEVAEVTDGGAIAGKVTFTGTDPDPQVYAITKDNEVCGTGDRTIDYVRVNNGALGNVVVYLDKVKSGKAFNDEEAKGNVNQKGCEFHPFLQVMHNKQEFSALNSDPVSHNIHTYELIGKSKKTVINVSQPDQESLYKKEIKLKRGNAMKIECDQHDFMHGFVFVAKNPYYAVVGDDGTFSIDNIPPGKYTVKAWHGTLGTEKAKVEVKAGDALTSDFEFKGK
jgi:Polysaccharide lyase family 4, domain II